MLNLSFQIIFVFLCRIYGALFHQFSNLFCIKCFAPSMKSDIKALLVFVKQLRGVLFLILIFGFHLFVTILIWWIII